MFITYLCRALLAGATVAIVHYVDFFRTTIEPPADAPVGTPPTYTFSAPFYIIILIKLAVYSLFSHTMFVCQMAYHAKISDPSIGGTYMTLLNTAANLGEFMLYVLGDYTTPTPGCLPNTS